MEKLKDALSRFVGLQRVHVSDLGEPREAVVDFGVVLHRAGPLADVDVAVDAGETPCRDASTIVSFQHGGLQILRQGALPASEIERVLSDPMQ